MKLYLKSCLAKSIYIGNTSYPKGEAETTLLPPYRKRATILEWGQNAAWNHPSKGERQAIFRTMSCYSNGNVKSAQLTTFHPTQYHSHVEWMTPTQIYLLGCFLAGKKYNLPQLNTQISRQNIVLEAGEWIRCLPPLGRPYNHFLLPTLNSCNLDAERGPW